MTTENDVRFDHRRPSTAQAEHCSSIRGFSKGLANYIEKTCPDCRERALAITKIEEAMMWSVAAIVRREQRED